MGGTEALPLSVYRYYCTLLKCAHCNGLGAITWDLEYREAAKDTSFVRVSGDFKTQAGRIDAKELAVVCTQCDAVYGPLPADSSH
jgi:hypothetical protein